MSVNGNGCNTGFHIWQSDCWINDESHILIKELIGYDLNSVLSPGALPAGAESPVGMTVLNSILYYFNTGLLSAAFFIFAFILIAGVIYTAQDGQFLGRKWGSAWIPLRAVFGTLMLFPVKASGFCFAQYLMLMVTYIGIGLANFVWYGVVGDVLTNQVVPVQDITVRMQLVLQLGQKVMSDALDTKLGSLIARSGTTQDGSTSIIMARQVPITSDYFASTTGGQTTWSEWFASSLPSNATYCYPDATCQSSPPGSVGPKSIPSDAINLFATMVSQTGKGYYSQTVNGKYVQAYVGTVVPVLDSNGNCMVEAFPGNCVAFANANVNFVYTPPESLDACSPSAGDITTRINCQASKVMADMTAVVEGSGAYTLLTRAEPGCFTLDTVNFRTQDTGGCIQSEITGDYTDSSPAMQARLAANPYMSAITTLMTDFKNPAYTDLFKNIDPAITTTGNPTAIGPLSSSFGSACGYSDMAQSNAFSAHCSGADSIQACQQKIAGCTFDVAGHMTDSTAACNAKIATYNTQAEKFNLFSSGGWFCAGNRYLQLDDQLGKNSQNMKNAVQAFANYQNRQIYKVTARDMGSYIHYVYAVGEFDVNGNLSFTNGAVDSTGQSKNEPPVVYKLPATGSLQNFMPSALSWNTLLFPSSRQIGGQTVMSPSLFDQAITGLCDRENLDPSSTECTLLIAYANRLKNLLVDSYKSLEANNAVGSRVLLYLNLNYITGNQGVRNSDLDPTKILDAYTVKFLYNILSFGLYNGFLRSDSFQAIPANLPPPPVNPVASANSVLDSLFAGLLGTNLNTSGTVFNANSAIFSPMLTTPAAGQPAANLSGDVVPGLTSKTSNVSQTGWLSAIYSLGMKCPTTPSSSSAAYCNSPMVQKQYSMIQTAQVIGVGLIGGALDSMKNAFSSLTAEVMTIANTYASQLERAAANGALWHGLLGSVGDIAGNYASDAGPIAMAAASGNMMISFANFSLQLMWLPLILFVMSAIFTAGISFAVIMPLTPFILFWAGKVAWILLFIESLLAAPLMALGIVYPDGHDLFGQSEPGIKLAVGMMLMPVLMVIGLFMGISLTYVVINFTATGFQAVMQSVLAMTNAVTTSASQTQGIIACFLIFFYSYVLTMAFEKCFSAIHVLPEKVLQWIGIQGQRFGEQEGQQMRSQMQQAGKEGAQAGGQSMTQGIQAQEQKGKATGDAAAKKSEAWMGSVNRATDGARSGFASGMGGR